MTVSPNMATRGGISLRSSKVSFSCVENWAADMGALAFATLLVLSVRFTPTLGGLTSTVSTMWGDANPSYSYYAVCAIQPGTLLPECTGRVEGSNGTINPPLTRFWAIAGGAYFSCGLTYPSHYPLCWGDGIDNSDAIDVPAAFKNVSYSSISSGAYHSCAIRDDDSGRVDCWGYNGVGELTTPAGVPFKAIAAGRQFTYGLRMDDGRAVIWGHSWKPESSKWVQESGSQYSAIFAGTYHVCGIEIVTKRTLCWGMNDDSQCVAPTSYNFSSISGGKSFTCGLREDNHEVLCWGDNTYGQCNSPSGIPFSFISAADYYICGVRRDTANISCWGNIKGNIQLASNEGLCKATCGDDQYYASNSCPMTSDKVCLACSICNNATSESFPCTGVNDRVCSQRPPPSPLWPSTPPPPRPTSSSHSLHIAYITAYVVGGIVFLGGVIFFVLCCKKLNKKKKDISWMGKDGVQELSASTLQAATSNYDDRNLLGKGASCHVYKGTLQSGQIVAIKRAVDKEIAKIFEQELDLLKRLNHMCLVNLLGYCKQEHILVFEFMENGSLFDCLFIKRIQLDWKRRIKIAAQAAKGLDYLHNGARPSIIHRDVKSANVLLDKNWNAHIADFGMSLFGPDIGHTHLSQTSAIGTPGYVDPQYALTLQLTSKSDVYSFGVVLLELLTGRRAYDKEQQSGIVAWAYAEYKPTKIKSMLDPSLVLPADIFSLVEMMELALQCVMVEINDRPDMVFVSRTLERCLQTCMDDLGPPSSTIDLTELQPSDIYSFGVVLLELLTGRRACDKG